MNLSEVPLIFHLSGKLCGAGIGSIVTGTSEASLENPRLSSLPSGCPGKNSNRSILSAVSLNIFIPTERVFLRLRIIRIRYIWIFNVDRIVEYFRFSPYSDIRMNCKQCTAVCVFFQFDICVYPIAHMHMCIN